MATVERAQSRFQPPDWFTSNYSISTNAERQRDASHQTRQESRFLRNETDNQTKWDQHSNNVRLAGRVDVIRKWKEILEKTLADLDKEIADLSEAKEHTEQALEAKNLPTDVAIECLTLREGRQSIDIVQDEPENQLHKVCGLQFTKSNWTTSLKFGSTAQSLYNTICMECVISELCYKGIILQRSNR